MDRVSKEFHKNVSILTKFVQPSDEFKKYFKEGMFDKPNTTGFYHVSYYLLSILYKDNIKNKVQWPLICKENENKFRNDVKECLENISHNNPDLNFPAILASNLILAKGTKFLLIMWKFSLAVLRTYLQRDHHTPTTLMPKCGPCQELSRKFLSNVAKNNAMSILEIRKETDRIIQTAQDFIRKKQLEHIDLKAEILEKKEELKESVTNAPVNGSAKATLINLKDDNLIELWKDHLNKELIEDIGKQLHEFERLDQFLKNVSNIVSNLTGDSQVLNGLAIERINIEKLSKSASPELQILLYNLYNMESLNLHNLFSVFNIFLEKYKKNVQLLQIEDLSKCNTQLEVSNKDLEVALYRFQNLHEQIESFSLNENKQRVQPITSDRIDSSILEYDKVLFMPSPSVQINSCFEAIKNIPQNDLKLTPIEGTYKELFSRHGNNNVKSIISTKKPLSVQRINFDDSMLNDASVDKHSMSQQRFTTPSKLKSTFKNADKYSRLFSSRKPNEGRVNNSVMMMMSNAGHSTFPSMPRQHCLSLLDSNLSQDISQEPLLLNPQLNSTIEHPKLGTEASQKRTKRRSIGDLVERYKRLLENSQLPNVTGRE